VGKEIGATPVLRELVDVGHRLILFTMRCNDKKRKNNTLNDALLWFRERDIPLFGVQTHPGQKCWTLSPKAYGDIYIDDTALGCPLLLPEEGPPYVDWGAVRRMLVAMGVLS
jgi:hypothetical protein